MILSSSAMKELFLTTVRCAKRKYTFRLENFCIMGNHFHFVIQPGRGQNLSAIMRWILSVFAMSFNKIMGYTGHVWGDRFYSRIIASLRSLLEVFEYIDSNPVRSKLVTDRREWRWGGLWYHRTGCGEPVDQPAAWLLPLLIGHRQMLLEQQGRVAKRTCALQGRGTGSHGKTRLPGR